MDAKNDERKQEILELADQIIRQKGFDSFSYADLAKELGISKAALHHHYPKKADLGVAFIEWKKVCYKEVMDQLLNSEVPASEKLRRYVRGITELFTDNPGQVCPLFAIQNDSNLLDKKVMIEAESFVREFELKLIKQIVSEGRKNGEFKTSGSVESQAVFLLSAMKGAMSNAKLLGTSVLQDLEFQIIEGIKS